MTTTTKSDLPDRIAAALGSGAEPAQIRALAEETEAAIAHAVGQRDEARARALDPTTKAALVPQARGDVFELDFRIERLAAALDRLRAEHETASARESEAARQALMAEVAAERDEIAAEIADRYPVLAAEIADLLSRARASDARAIPLGLDRAESVARSIPGNGYVGSTPATYLVDGVRLPELDPLAAAMGSAIWPPPKPKVAALPSALSASSASRGAEIRQIGEEVAIRKQAEAGSPRRRVG